MAELLQRAGFRLRGRNRADCIHCHGRSTATLSFNTNVAHCFRCHWKANIISLGRQLGIARSSLAFVPERERRHRRIIASFGGWRDGHIRRISGQLRQLGCQAARAAKVLETYPDCEPAWVALERFYHREAELHRQLDWLCCTKASCWLYTDSKILDVFEAWEKR